MTQTEQLAEQINKAKKEYVTDGYSMSIGEIVSMYKDEELNINPDFQRKFRWSPLQQSRLIESILIGVPLPSIFVYQNQLGKWEVVDGVQRISTILAFMGELPDEKGLKNPTILTETKMLPSLKGMTWTELPKEPFQLDFRRSKIEVKIIKSTSDTNAKFEVFQRLNYAPSFLSGQEYRNALLIMVNKEIYTWVELPAKDNNFQTCIDLTERWTQESYDYELVLRLFIFSYYTSGNIYKIDDYLDEHIFYSEGSLIENISLGKFNLDEEKLKFSKTFKLLFEVKGQNVFKKEGRGTQFLESYFEAIAIGLYWNVNDYDENDIELLKEKILSIEENIPKALNASSRIPKTVKFGKEYFKK